MVFLSSSEDIYPVFLSASRMLVMWVAAGIQLVVHQSTIDIPPFGNAFMLIPIPRGQYESADIRFIDLDDYPSLFVDLNESVPSGMFNSTGRDKEPQRATLHYELSHVDSMEELFHQDWTGFTFGDDIREALRSIYESDNFSFVVAKIPKKHKKGTYSLAYTFINTSGKLFAPTREYGHFDTLATGWDSTLYVYATKVVVPKEVPLNYYRSFKMPWYGISKIDIVHILTALEDKHGGDDLKKKRHERISLKSRLVASLQCISLQSALGYCPDLWLREYSRLDNLLGE